MEDWLTYEDLLSALCARGDFEAEFEFELDGKTRLPAHSAILGAVAVLELLKFSAASSEPSSVVKVTVTADNDVTRLEATFVPGPVQAAWPPLGLAVAAEASGAQYATGPDGDMSVAVLVMPCP